MATLSGCPCGQLSNSISPDKRIYLVKDLRRHYVLRGDRVPPMREGMTYMADGREWRIISADDRKVTMEALVVVDRGATRTPARPAPR